MTEREIRLVIADDDPIVREALRTVLGRGGDIVTLETFGNGRDVVEFARLRHADVFLLDLHMPILDGLSTTMALRTIAPQSAVLLITSSETEGAEEAARAAGAAGLLVKTTPPRAIIAAIQDCAARRPVVVPGIGGDAPRAAEPLTRREREILQLLCEAKTNQEIADTLSLTEATVKSHITSIMAKLHVNSRLKAVVTALRQNICKI